MLGNVLEWTDDVYDEKFYRNSLGIDPQATAEGKYRVLRGVPGAILLGLSVSRADSGTSHRFGTTTPVCGVAGSCQSAHGREESLPYVRQELLGGRLPPRSACAWRCPVPNHTSIAGFRCGIGPGVVWVLRGCAPHLLWRDAEPVSLSPADVQARSPRVTASHPHPLSARLRQNMYSGTPLMITTAPKPEFLGSPTAMKIRKKMATAT